MEEVAKLDCGRVWLVGGLSRFIRGVGWDGMGEKGRREEGRKERRATRLTQFLFAQ